MGRLEDNTSIAYWAVILGMQNDLDNISWNLGPIWKMRGLGLWGH